MVTTVKNTPGYYEHIAKILEVELRILYIVQDKFGIDKSARITEIEDALVWCVAFMRALNPNRCRPQSIQYLIKHQPIGRAGETIEFFITHGY